MLNILSLYAKRIQIKKQTTRPNVYSFLPGTVHAQRASFKKVLKIATKWGKESPNPADSIDI